MIKKLKNLLLTYCLIAFTPCFAASAINNEPNCKGMACSLIDKSCDATDSTIVALTKKPLQISYANKIKWRTYNSALLKEAKAGNLHLLIYIRSSNCEWSKRMEEVTFNNLFIKDFINHHFIPVFIDFNQDRDLASRYGVMKLPVIIILDANNKPVKTLAGYISKSDLAVKLNEVVKGK